MFPFLPSFRPPLHTSFLYCPVACCPAIFMRIRLIMHKRWEKPFWIFGDITWAASLKQTWSEAPNLSRLKRWKSYTRHEDLQKSTITQLSHWWHNFSPKSPPDIFVQKHSKHLNRMSLRQQCRARPANLRFYSRGMFALARGRVSNERSLFTLESSADATWKFSVCELHIPRVALQCLKSCKLKRITLSELHQLKSIDVERIQPTLERTSFSGTPWSRWERSWRLCDRQT